MRNSGDGLRKGKETDNNRRRVHMHGKQFLGRQRRSEDVRVAQIAKERRRRSVGRREREKEREGKGCRARHGKSSRSFSRRVSRLPSASLAHIHYPLLHSFARACTQPRERSLYPSSSLLVTSPSPANSLTAG